MESRKKPKKYVVGGIIAAGVAGLGQAIYGGVQAAKAGKELKRLQGQKPDLNLNVGETPAEYYKAFKEAYDQDIMNRQMESIKTGLAGTTEALSGAGGRALLGGIGAATQQAQRQMQGVADIQQQRQTEALGLLASAKERTRDLQLEAQAKTLGMRESRSQADIAGAQASRDAGIQNVAGGLGQIASAGVYGSEMFGKKKPEANASGTTMEKGGVMKTPGPFSHKTNPIDIMKGGKKIAEATGGEYIFNPKQMSNIKKFVSSNDKNSLHSYVRSLIKKFEK
jgi:hypothetical protein